MKKEKFKTQRHPRKIRKKLRYLRKMLNATFMMTCLLNILFIWGSCNNKHTLELDHTMWLHQEEGIKLEMVFLTEDTGEMLMTDSTSTRQISFEYTISGNTLFLNAEQSIPIIASEKPLGTIYESNIFFFNSTGAHEFVRKDGFVQ